MACSGSLHFLAYVKPADGWIAGRWILFNRAQSAQSVRSTELTDLELGRIVDCFSTNGKFESETTALGESFRCTY